MPCSILGALLPYLDFATFPFGADKQTPAIKPVHDTMHHPRTTFQTPTPNCIVFPRLELHQSPEQGTYLQLYVPGLHHHAFAFSPCALPVEIGARKSSSPDDIGTSRNSPRQPSRHGSHALNKSPEIAIVRRQEVAGGGRKSWNSRGGPKSVACSLGLSPYQHLRDLYNKPNRVSPA